MSAEDEAWTESFVEVATSFLAEHYGVSTPHVVLHCEETCPWVDSCHYMACYMPWAQQINIRSGSEYGFIVSHEFGHHLQQKGLLEEGEGPAILAEKWWAKSVNELSCEVCGAPLFVSEETVQGSEIICEKCGSIYEAVQIH